MKMDIKAAIIILISVGLLLTAALTLRSNEDRIDRQAQLQEKKDASNPEPPQPEAPVEEKQEEKEEVKPDTSAAVQVTQYESTKKKLVQDINIQEISTYKNRNSVVYTALDKDSSALYRADIDRDGNLSNSTLVDKEVVETGRTGISNISTGNAFEYAMYFSAREGNTSIIFNDLNTMTKKTLYTFGQNEDISRVLFNSTDSGWICAKTDENGLIKILSGASGLNSMDFESSNAIHTIDFAPQGELNAITWIDITNDNAKLLYCIKDSKTLKPVLWVYDIKLQRAYKLTDDDKTVLTAKWSGDGRKIVYSMEEEEGASNIFVYDYESKSTARITSGKGKNYSPDWSYYGNEIIYVSQENGTGSIYGIEFK